MSALIQKRVGFWAPPKTLSDSVFGAIAGSIMSTLTGLPYAEDQVDWDWDPAERDTVYRYVTNIDFAGMAYCGFSTCRICGCQNGTLDFEDGTYVWPEGFGHYIKEHGVKPPEDFILHVMKRSAG